MIPLEDLGEFAEKRWRVTWIVYSVGLYVLLCAVTAVAILSINQGHFAFGLDDPYIHLALAQQIAHGHYGINVNEASSPSSSLLWPMLLAPLTLTRWPVAATLLLNVFCGIGSAWLIGVAVGEWPGKTWSREEMARRALSVTALLFLGNTIGLTFIGMEHMLQMMLTLACALGIAACLQGRRVPAWCIAAAIVGPWVRYENVAITLGLCFALWGQDRRRMAATAMTAGILPLVLFSVFLHAHGLPLLPTSVIVKSGAAGAPPGFLSSYAKAWIGQTARSFSAPDRGPLTVLFLTLAGLTWTQTGRVRRFALGGATAATGLHLAIGRFGWFHRYEVYILAFAAVVTFYVLHERPRMLFGWYALGLLALAMPYFDTNLRVWRASNEIYRLQYQTHRLTSEFYRGNIAVGDLGLVSFNRPQGQYVLDLTGLGLVEAALQKDKSPAWLDSITRRHDIGLVAVSEPLQGQPASWTPLGQVCVTGRTLVLEYRCVSYYATSLAPRPQMEQTFGAFVKTLPPGVVATEYH